MGIWYKLLDVIFMKKKKKIRAIDLVLYIHCSEIRHMSPLALCPTLTAGKKKKKKMNTFFFFFFSQTRSLKNNVKTRYNTDETRLSIAFARTRTILSLSLSLSLSLFCVFNRHGTPYYILPHRGPQSHFIMFITSWLLHCWPIKTQ